MVRSSILAAQALIHKGEKALESLEPSKRGVSTLLLDLASLYQKDDQMDEAQACRPPQCFLPHAQAHSPRTLFAVRTLSRTQLHLVTA